MTTATQPPPVTATADRFRCASEIPDPPPDAAGRKQYWEDTVAEAVAELRRRLASNYDEKSFQALEMILDLEKTRIRHKEPVAGTQVERRFDCGLGSLEDSTFSGGKYQGPVAKQEDLTPPAPPATLSVPERVEGPVPPQDGCGAADNSVPLNTPSPERVVESSAWSPKPARPIPLRERVKLQDGIHGHFHDHDDDYLLERRGRRKREPKPEPDVEESAEAVWKALLAAAPPPRPLRSHGLCILSPRDDAPDEEPPAIPDDDVPANLSGMCW